MRRARPPLDVAACGLALLIASGCGWGGKPERTAPRFTVAGAVHLRAVLRDETGAVLGHRTIRDADGVRVELLGDVAVVEATSTVDGVYSFTTPFPGELEVRTAVGQALADTAEAILQYDLYPVDTLRLFSDEVMQAAPSPFTFATSIRFAVPVSMPVVVDVRSVSSAVVRTLIDQPLVAGLHIVMWDGADAFSNPVADGAYWIVMTQGAVQNAELVIKGGSP